MVIGYCGKVPRNTGIDPDAIALGNVLVELCPEGDFSEKIPTGAGPYCKKSGPLRAFLSVRCQHFVVASHLWGVGGRLACSVQAISAIYGKQDGRNRRDRDYCVCSDLLAMDTEGAQMTHPKHPSGQRKRDRADWPRPYFDPPHFIRRFFARPSGAR